MLAATPANHVFSQIPVLRITANSPLINVSPALVSSYSWVWVLVLMGVLVLVSGAGSVLADSGVLTCTVAAAQGNPGRPVKDPTFIATMMKSWTCLLL